MKLSSDCWRLFYNNNYGGTNKEKYYICTDLKNIYLSEGLL